MENFNELIKSDKPVLVDFFATWCGPCKMMSPVIDRIKEAVGDKAEVVKIDVDQNRDLVIRYRIQSVPTLMLFKNGELLWREVGVHQEQDILNLLEKNY